MTITELAEQTAHIEQVYQVTQEVYDSFQRCSRDMNPLHICSRKGFQGMCDVREYPQCLHLALCRDVPPHSTRHDPVAGYQFPQAGIPERSDYAAGQYRYRI